MYYILYNGTAIHLQACNAKIQKCHFFDNSITYNGGFIYYDPYYADSEAKLIVNDNFFNKRKSNYCCVRICLSDTWQFQASFFESSPSYGVGNTNCGSLYEDDKRISIDRPVGFFYFTFSRVSNDADELGGSVYISISSTFETDITMPIQIYNSFFTTCSADFGGAIYIASAENSRLFDIFECLFEMNRYVNSFTTTDESSCGGAIYIYYYTDV